MMHRRRHNPAPHRRRREEALPGFVAEALRRPGSAPDLTRAIMGRLGYMRAAPRVVRRERLRRNLGRGLFSLALIALLGVAVHLHEQSPLARRPAEVTLPAAIRNDLDRHPQQDVGLAVAPSQQVHPV